MKKIITLVTLMLVLLMAMCAVASAGDDHAAVTWSNPQSRSTPAISSVSSSITKASSTSVTIKAKTTANQSVDSVGGRAIIQRWNNNKWESYKSYNFNAYDTSSCSLNKTVTVASGYTYRLRVGHSVNDLDGNDAVNTTTSSVTVP